MPLTKLTCPKCSAILRPSKPVPEGKTIKCPKCSKSFVAGDDLSEAVQAKPGAKKPAVSPAAPKPDDDEDGPGVYSFREDPAPAPVVRKKPRDDDDDDDDEDDEEDDEAAKAEEEKKKMYMLDESVKDPRGPAQEAVIKPSNILMLTAIILIGLQIFSLFIWAFPFIFQEHVLEPKDVLKTDKEGKPIKLKPGEPDKAWKDLTDAEKKKMEDAIDAETERRLLWMIPNVAGIIWCAVTVLAAYKMQNMESYPWSWVGASMMILGGGFVINGLWWLHDFLVEMDADQGEPISFGIMGVAGGICVLVGVVCMITLNRKVVKFGFYWVPD